MTPMKNKRTWMRYITENGSYKLVALFVTLILWITIMGRRNFDYEVDLVLVPQISKNQDIISQSAQSVYMKLRGTRRQIKQFKREYPKVKIDLRGEPAGSLLVALNSGVIELPDGLKLIKIRPRRVEFEISEMKDAQ